MEDEKKVFFSEITRVDFEHKNNLYDLLTLTPAKPVAVKTSENETCTFEPRCGKYYAPQRRSGLKVRTVREIRHLFEQDNYNFIIEDMKKQQSALLTKIRTGSSTDDSTKKMATKLLHADHPISRTAWQILNNINADKNVNPIQFVLCNGRRIRVVGSRGGKNKFICNQDLGKNNIEELKKKCSIEYNTKKKKYGLLRDSLNIKFKPGPLRRKKTLDVSYQKYHIGPAVLVKLPKPALEIQPAYGIILEPIMSSLLKKLRPEDGTITEKWAEFAVSVLGTVQNNSIVQVDKECCVTFDLSYKCDQDRILMRRDIGRVSSVTGNVGNPKYTFIPNQSDNMPEIQEILNNILDCVEISLQQDCMYSVKNESQETIPDALNNSIDNLKEKNKKKYGELDKLAVTVIQLPVTPNHKPLKLCEKSYCRSGCLCNSLNCSYTFKQHCGHFECMFGCKCELSKYKDKEFFENDCNEIIPGLMKLDNEINANLAKEEQKFHQTVVFSGEKSIFFKSRKRTSKSTMKYAEFNSNNRIKNEHEPKKILTVVCKKLNCANIEPWCMVHNLYNCFCKCRFTETSVFNTVKSLPVTTSTVEPDSADLSDDVVVGYIKNSLRPRRVLPQSRESSEKSIGLETNVSKDFDCDNTSCARTDEYRGRKYDDNYYKVTHVKISEMEKNDTKLHKKMMRLIMNTSPSPQCTNTLPFISSNTSTPKGATLGCGGEKEFIESSHNKTKIDKKYLQNNNQSLAEINAEDSSKLSDNAKLVQTDSLLEDEDSQSSTEPSIPFEISGDIYKPIKGHRITQEFLTPWIAKSYKNYKEQISNGKSTLERPKRGRIILHLWECLLSRYKSRKNYFVTTRKRPFRIYIATQIWKPFFKECVNINAIQFSDLDKYPGLVKKLVTNASNKDYFCILGGWDDCWEIIGSVKKNETASDTDLSHTENTRDSDSQDDNWSVREEHAIMTNSPNANCLPEFSKEELEKIDLDRSKWFLMKLETDFTEIYCHKKGFYVEREKILHAINLARVTRKTVVINKQTCKEITNIPFGIYALPDTNDYCAVVGPYEMNEDLGLEIVKANTYKTQKSTKGYWITTNKVDNIKVINDPMSFLPSDTVQTELRNVLSANATNPSKVNVQPSTSKETQEALCLGNEVAKKKTKVVKPIKISRTNGFFHLTSKNKNISLRSAISLNSQNQILFKEPKRLCGIANESDSQIVNLEEINASSKWNTREKKKTGMFILKPEEINKKITDGSDQNKNEYNVNEVQDEEENCMDMDIENFLNEECSASDDDVILLSDGESEENDTKTNKQKWTDVWINCSTIKNLGLIRGKRNEENLLSIYDFPGFEPSILYSESETFERITQ